MRNQGAPRKPFAEMSSGIRRCIESQSPMTLELAHIRALIEAGFLRWLADHETKEMLVSDTAQIPKQHQPRAYSPATLAEHWSVSAETIRRLIKAGELQAQQYGKLWRITAQAVEEYENRNMLYSPSDDRSA